MIEINNGLNLTKIPESQTDSSAIKWDNEMPRSACTSARDIWMGGDISMNVLPHPSFFPLLPFSPIFTQSLSGLERYPLSRSRQINKQTSEWWNWIGRKWKADGEKGWMGMEEWEWNGRWRLNCEDFRPIFLLGWTENEHFWLEDQGEGRGNQN